MQVKHRRKGRLVHSSAGTRQSRLLGRLSLHNRRPALLDRRRPRTVHLAELQQAADLCGCFGDADAECRSSIRRTRAKRKKLQ